MKKLSLILVALFSLGLMAGCGESSETVESTKDKVELGNASKKKAGAVESDNGLKN